MTVLNEGVTSESQTAGRREYSWQREEQTQRPSLSLFMSMLSLISDPGSLPQQ